MLDIVSSRRQVVAGKQIEQEQTDLPVVGVADGCSYRISRFWYERIGTTNLDTVCRILADGGSTHFSAVDDGKILQLEFASYIVYTDQAIRNSTIAVALFGSLFRGNTRERVSKCTDSWNRLLKNTRNDMATAAMRIGLLQKLCFQRLNGVDDGAFIQASVDSILLRRMLTFPESILGDLEDAIKRIAHMRAQKGQRK